MKKKNKGYKFEKKVSKNIASGALWFAPLDINYDNYLVECKMTDKKGYRINLNLLEKIWGKSLNLNKEPLLVIGIKRNDNENFILTCRLGVEKR